MDALNLKPEPELEREPGREDARVKSIETRPIDFHLYFETESGPRKSKFPARTAGQRIEVVHPFAMAISKYDASVPVLISATSGKSGPFPLLRRVK